MWQTFRNSIDDDFIDAEDIIAKVQYLENLTNRHQYATWGNQANSFSTRLSYAIQSLPEEHRKAALALFANIIYIPKPILDEAWREVAFSLESRLVKGSALHFSDCAYFAVDNPGLVTQFSHLAGLMGREDHDANPGFDTVSALIDRLYNLLENKRDNVDISDLVVLMKKKNWIMLSDNAISGGSLISDAKKLLQIKSILFPDGLKHPFLQEQSAYSFPNINVAVQLITEQAVDGLDGMIPREKIAYGLKFDDGFRVASDRCKLFQRDDTLKAVRRLCEWFGDEYFLNEPNPNFRKRLEVHISNGGKENYAYGWKDCGYTIVTQDNALSNSVPIIYYAPNGTDRQSDIANPQVYVSPFPRVESRISHTTSNDKEKIATLVKWDNANYIREVIYSRSE